MSQTQKKDLDSTGSLIALVAAALGAATEVIAFIGFFLRSEAGPNDPSLVVVDGAIALLALLGVGQMIKNPNSAAPILAGAGVGSFVSDMVGLSTPPRMIPGALMILSAVVIFGTRKDEVSVAKGSSETDEVADSSEPLDSKEPVPVPVAVSPVSPDNEPPHWLPVLVVVALGLHIVGGGFIGLGAGLVAPPLGVLAGWLIWAAILYAGIRLRKTKPWYAVATPFLGIAAWVLLLLAGGEILGWTA